MSTAGNILSNGSNAVDGSTASEHLLNLTPPNGILVVRYKSLGATISSPKHSSVAQTLDGNQAMGIISSDRTTRLTSNSKGNRTAEL